MARNYAFDFTFIVIDGIPVSIRDYRFLDALPIEGIKSVELIKRSKKYRHYEHKIFTGSTLNEIKAEFFIDLFKKHITEVILFWKKVQEYQLSVFIRIQKKVSKACIGLKECLKVLFQVLPPSLSFIHQNIKMLQLVIGIYKIYVLLCIGRQIL